MTLNTTLIVILELLELLMSITVVLVLLSHFFWKPLAVTRKVLQSDIGVAGIVNVNNSGTGIVVLLLLETIGSNTESPSK